MPTIHQVPCTCIFLELYPMVPHLVTSRDLQNWTEEHQSQGTANKFLLISPSGQCAHRARAWKIRQLDAVFTTWVIVVIVSGKKSTIATCLLIRHPAGPREKRPQKPARSPYRPPEGPERYWDAISWRRPGWMRLQTPGQTSEGNPYKSCLFDARQKVQGLPRWLSSKESSSQCRRFKRPGLIPGKGSPGRRSPGEGNSNPLQYSCLENPMGRGAWRATVHRVAKESDMT